MTREEAIALMSPEAIAIGTRRSGGLEAFLDDVIKHGVTAEELKRWVAIPLDRKSDGPEFVCAVITTSLWSCGGFGGYTITPVGDQKFVAGDDEYLSHAVQRACPIPVPSGVHFDQREYDADGDPQIPF